MSPPTLTRQPSSRYEMPARFPDSLSYAPDSSPHRRILRGPSGRRASFERQMLEGLFLKAFCLSAFSNPSSRDSHKKSLSQSTTSSDVLISPPLSPQQPPTPTPTPRPLSARATDEYFSISAEESEESRHGEDVIRQIRRPRWRGGVPREHLEVIGEEAKGRLLGRYVPVPAEKMESAADVVGRLRVLSPGTVERFEMKAASRGALVFRLLFARPRSKSRVNGRMVKGERADGENGGNGTNVSNGTHQTNGADRANGTHVTNGSNSASNNKFSISTNKRRRPAVNVRENGDGGGSGEVDGYYALSYRWQSHPDAPDPRLANCKKYAKGIPPEKFIAAPVSDEMFEAIMEELPGLSQGRYGLWCDQMCIDQSNNEERATAVGMMDSIYRAAEKVVIALDDIEINGEEMQAMIQFSAWHDHHTGNGRIPENEDLYYMRDKPTLRSGVEKIIYSDYFDRAWCAHEFELADDRVALVRTNQRTTDGRLKVVRIEDAKLHSLMLLLALLDRQVLTPVQAARRVNVELLASRDSRDDPNVHSQMVHDMQTLSLIFSMKNGGDPTLPDDLREYSAVRDKMSIMLNASDLALIPAADLDIQGLPIPLAHARIYEYISLLMLASGNPLVLATTSRALLADEDHDSWLRKFWLLDAGVDTSLPRLQRPLPIRVDPAPGSRWIELDMLFPSAAGGGGVLHTASDKFIKHASKFVTDFRSSSLETIESETENHPLVVLDSRREYLTHLIACVLECRWTWGYGPFPKEMVTPTSPTTAQKLMARPRKRMKYSSEKTWDYFFGIDVDLDRIPESFEWNRKASNEREQKTAKDMAAELMSNLLQTAPLPETRGDATAWRPAWFEIRGPEVGSQADGSADGSADVSRCRYIAMVPKDGGTYRAAIPEVLKGNGYSGLARCWILEELEEKGNWVVRNRSKLIMANDTLEQEHKDGFWEQAERQKVWGRTRGPASDAEEAIHDEPPIAFV